MSTTAATLEALTDRARFEVLATSILRKAAPRYAGIIQTGLNAEGETIVSPVDGLSLLTDSTPPHYVFVQHTTTDRARLRGKWLTATDADLVKAAAEARRVRQTHTNAIVTVVLTTTQRVDLDFAQDVYREAAAHNIVPDIWDQHRLADFLDTTPDGQWLRKHHLGVEADRLSADLLHRIGRDSLALYQQEVVPPNHPQLIDRNVAPAILEAVAGGGLCLVVGRSGFGKSVATVQALQHGLVRGGLGLWLPARVLEGATSLEAALSNWLRTLCPFLQTGAGPLAVELGANRGGLVLYLDDVNRSPDAARLVRAAASAAAPSASGNGGSGTGSGDTSAPRPAVVVPVWPEQLEGLSTGLTKAAWIKTVHVGELLSAECERIIRDAVPRLSSASATEYANRLNYDPLLVGLFATLVGDQMNDAELGAVADDAVGRFVESQVRELTQAAGVDLLPTELIAALNRVAHEMLARRLARPSWSDLTTWLGADSQTVRAMRALLRQGGICRLDDENRLAFRHDRLRDRFLADAVSDLLRAKELAEGVIADPHYAAVVGKAIAGTPVTADRLSRIRVTAPWALFEAVRQIGEPTQLHHEQVFTEAQTWAATESRTAPELILTMVCWSLLETDSSRIFPLIEAMNPNHLLMAAGLRNGAARYGMRFIRGSARGHFEPGVGDLLRSRLVDHAARRYGPQLGAQLREELGRADLPPLDVNSYLALVGHFRFPGFDDLIRGAWERHGDEVLSYAIWASARCLLPDTPALMGPLLERLSTLPVRDDLTQSLTEREWMTQHLRWAFRNGITHEAVACLIQSATVNNGLREDVAHILGEVDDPDAAELVVRSLAAAGSGITIGDGELEVSLRSTATTDRLRTLWESTTEEDNVRSQAFIAWLRGTGSKDATILRPIGPESPLYQTAIQHRVKLADPTVVPDLLALLRADDSHGFWWWMSYRVWCSDLRVLASETLASFKNHIPDDFSRGRSDYCYWWGELLVKIPVGDAIEILTAHWGHLKYSPAMVQAAYRIGTPAAVTLAEQSLTLCPREVDIFHLAFSTTWARGNPTNPVTLQHLRNLEPHLDRMTEQEVLFLAWETERAVGSDGAIANWIRTQLVPRLQPVDQERVQVADQRLIATLDRQFVQTQFGSHLGFLFEERNGQRFVFPARRLALLDTWLSTHRTVRGLEVAGECLRHIGTRRDLDLLDRYPIEGDQTEIERVKASVRFAVRRRTLE